MNTICTHCLSSSAGLFVLCFWSSVLLTSLHIAGARPWRARRQQGTRTLLPRARSRGARPPGRRGGEEERRRGGGGCIHCTLKLGGTAQFDCRHVRLKRTFIFVSRRPHRLSQLGNITWLTFLLASVTSVTSSLAPAGVCWTGWCAHTPRVRSSQLTTGTAHANYIYIAQSPTLGALSEHCELLPQA